MLRVVPTLVFAPTSFTARVATLAVSVSAHGAVALVTLGGHGAQEASLAALPDDRTIEIAEPESLAAAAASPRTIAPAATLGPARGRSAGSEFRSHTHPYAVAVDHDAIPHDPSLSHPPVTTAASLPITTDATSTPASSPTAVAAPAMEAPRFTLTVGHDSRPSGGASGGGVGAGSDPPISEETADRPAALVSGSPPAYTREAEAAGVEADVPLEIVVDTQGAVVRARVITTVGYGLDEVALVGIRAYRFAPALREGRPVAVRMHWLMRFRLR